MKKEAKIFARLKASRALLEKSAEAILGGVPNAHDRYRIVVGDPMYEDVIPAAKSFGSP